MNSNGDANYSNLKDYTNWGMDGIRWDGARGKMGKQ